MEKELEQEWRRRAGAFYRSCMPYIGDMIRSGLPLVIFALIIIGAAYYTDFIANIPADFPAAAVGALLLTPVLYWSPMRTWLKPADIVFLMPREGAMGPYTRRSLRHTLPGGLLLSAAVLLLYWPIRAHVPQDALTGWSPALFPVLAALLALKLLAGAAAWRERQIAWPASRMLLKAVRLALTAWLIYVWLTAHPLTALLMTLPSLFLWWAASRLPARHGLPWERLIQEEERTEGRYMGFFGWFTDVPSQPSSVRSRPYFSWIAAVIPLRRRSTYTYLYSLSAARTELGGMLLRLTLIGMLCSYWLGDSVWLGGWGAAVCTLLFLVIAGLQSSALVSWHRHTVWRHVYPLPELERLRSAAVVDRFVLAVIAVLLWLSGCLPLLLDGALLPAVLAGAGMLVYVLMRPRRMLRKQLMEEEDD
ncbi:ABC transporter permease [Paenibacillus pasadenensis]|uniref:ABC transporter permease n=1 Tax=Paenibacillus pasadenensis TaxID=217090 RepID=UPI00203FB1DE|nr:ABC transporter permease [Paenibacillus pasadenensis]MCM3746844.1 ABC transporter permease [Paenibacillus pasadenensis]